LPLLGSVSSKPLVIEKRPCKYKGVSWFTGLVLVPWQCCSLQLMSNLTSYSIYHCWHNFVTMRFSTRRLLLQNLYLKNRIGLWTLRFSLWVVKYLLEFR
jgi:hypothetical protein